MSISEMSEYSAPLPPSSHSPSLVNAQTSRSPHSASSTIVVEDGGGGGLIEIVVGRTGTDEPRSLARPRASGQERPGLEKRSQSWSKRNFGSFVQNDILGCF